MALSPTISPDLIRPPAVAGMFYPSNPKELEATVEHFLSEATAKFDAAERAPKAIIAPHAGYVYSGLTAAAVYNRLRPAKDIIKRVVILGPCHRVAVNGLALPSTEVFQTPLGDVPLDMDAAAEIIGLPQVEIFNDTHVEDHSLEVHLPFLQKVLGDFKIVPMIVGQATPEQVAEVLDILWGGPETLILISSDLSHYLPYDQAKALDNQTCQAIERLDAPALGNEQACGRHSIKGLLLLAREKGLNVKTADIRNSGDTAGTKDKVVGYGSWYFDEGGQPKAKPQNDFGAATRDLLAAHGQTLLHVGAAAILTHLKGSGPMRLSLKEFAEPLRDHGACFVTLNKNDQLRGCIGSIQAWRPLLTDVAENACKAAFGDNRFPKLTLAEIEGGGITMSISVLSPQTKMEFTSEADFLSQLHPGVDGIVLQEGQTKRGVFLPVVWEQLPDPKKFLSHLKRKASLPEDYWSDSLQAWRYVTEGVSSKDLPEDQPLWELD
ncbi:MAG: AmmeMemoRadiSam system protein B [Rhodospirillaceae bacterium]|jgi:MEMO1 family protein|nr:AmmeMemoRadiSam system protein B [Rhodospirillaceae bacterium]MBT4940532.1 AmmeMemoRadiSam system protein B [Rhodospirillaceae bacterium]MBT7266266.1 AmmeMemoRadiSam system protein B [Rhodospirillaceae bacterium]